MSSGAPGHHRWTTGPERLIAFSDAVFSVAMTLSVVEVMPADLNEKILSVGALAVLKLLVPKLAGFALTFVIVGVFWLAHHRMFNYIARSDERFLVLNLVFLILIALMPFSIKFSVAGPHDTAAVVFYATYMAATGLSLHVIWRYATHSRRLIDPRVDGGVIKENLIRTAAAPAIFALSIPAALVSVDFARVLWLGLLFATRIKAPGGAQRRPDDPA